jgi:hypothetical protein
MAIAPRRCARLVGQHLGQRRMRSLTRRDLGRILNRRTHQRMPEPECHVVDNHKTGGDRKLERFHGFRVFKRNGAGGQDLG